MFGETEAYGLTFAFPERDTAVGHCLSQYGEFSWPGVALARQLSRGRTFIDVGANVGTFALPVGRSARHVVAIEAHPGLAELLRSNARRNGLANVQVESAIAGACVGEAEFQVLPLDTQMNFGALRVGKGEKRPVVPIDAYRTDDLALVKVDVEGYEPAVLEGAADTLAQGCHWILEVNEDPAGYSVIETLRRAGLRVYWFWIPFVTPLAPKRRWIGKYLGDLNIFALPASYPQPGGMIEANPDHWPTNLVGFEYLRPFGWGDDQLSVPPPER